MDQFFLHAVEHYGYLIILLGVGMESMGIPLPGETTLLAGAFLAAQGHLLPWAVALSAWVGAVVGDNVGYGVGRRWGRRLLTVRGIRRIWDPGKVAIAEDFFARRGWLAVFFGRFVALLRIFAGPLAGMHRMHWRTFFLANALGGAAWVGSIVTVGLLLGKNYDSAVKLVSRAGYVGLALAAVLVLLAVVWHLRRRRHERARGDQLLAQQREASQTLPTGTGDSEG